MISPRRRYALALPSGSVLELGARTLVMGILNVTPDSFADGGDHLDPGLAIAAALQLEADGADIVDIGGESTRPGAEALSNDAEIARVLPVVEGVASKIGVPVSIDTYKAEVARLAIDSGASIVNDVSALSYDPALAGVVAATGVPIVLTHNRGRSQEMYREAHYVSTPNEVERELGGAIERAMLAGISRAGRRSPRRTTQPSSNGFPWSPGSPTGPPRPARLPHSLTTTPASHGRRALLPRPTTSTEFSHPPPESTRRTALSFFCW